VLCFLPKHVDRSQLSTAHTSTHQARPHMRRGSAYRWHAGAALHRMCLQAAHSCWQDHISKTAHSGPRLLERAYRVTGQAWMVYKEQASGTCTATCSTPAASHQTRSCRACPPGAASSRSRSGAAACQWARRWPLRSASLRPRHACRQGAGLFMLTRSKCSRPQAGSLHDTCRRGWASAHTTTMHASPSHATARRLIHDPPAAPGDRLTRRLAGINCTCKLPRHMRIHNHDQRQHAPRLRRCHSALCAAAGGSCAGRQRTGRACAAVLWTPQRLCAPAESGQACWGPCAALQQPCRSPYYLGHVTDGARPSLI